MSNGNDPDLANFVALSAVLTGFSLTVDPIDPEPVGDEYLAVLKNPQNADQTVVSKMLAAFASINNQSPPLSPLQLENAVQQQILSDPEMLPIAQNVIRMWYLSIWYSLTQPQPITGFSGGFVVSMNAYTKGLSWDAAQAHPMGYSEMHFGYWADVPQPDDS